MYMINGCGTTLYGRTPLPDQEGYIATKWFCIVWVPLIPIESYIVYKESGYDVIVWSDKEYQLAKLPEIYKPHLKTYYITITVVMFVFLALVFISIFDDHEIDYSNNNKEIESNNAYKYNELGIEYSERNENEKAIEYFTQAISYSPNSPTILLNRAAVYFEMSEYNLAINDANNVLRNDMTYVDAYDLKGSAYNELGIYDSSIINFKRALFFDSLNPNYYLDLSDAYYALNFYDSSIYAINLCIDKGIKRDYIYCQRGYINFGLGEFKSALIDADSSLIYNYSYPMSHLLRAQVLDELSETKKAIKSYEAFIKFADTSYLEELTFVKGRIEELNK